MLVGLALFHVHCDSEISFENVIIQCVSIKKNNLEFILKITTT